MNITRKLISEYMKWIKKGKVMHATRGGPRTDRTAQIIRLGIWNPRRAGQVGRRLLSRVSPLAPLALAPLQAPAEYPPPPPRSPRNLLEASRSGRYDRRRRDGAGLPQALRRLLRQQGDAGTPSFSTLVCLVSDWVLDGSWMMVVLAGRWWCLG